MPAREALEYNKLSFVVVSCLRAEDQNAKINDDSEGQALEVSASTSLVV